MTGNWDNYALMFYDDPFEECRDCFWSYLGDDDTLPKEFLEHLQEMVDRIDRGEEKLIPMDLDQMNRLKDLTSDVELYDVEDLKKDMDTLENWMNDNE